MGARQIPGLSGTSVTELLIHMFSLNFRLL